MGIFAIVLACLARASPAYRVQNNAHQGAHSQPTVLEAFAALLHTSTPDATWQATSIGPSSKPAVQKVARQNWHPRIAVVRMEEEKSLEQQLKDGEITQEDYDLLSSAIEEDEYLEEMANEVPEKTLSEEAQKQRALLESKDGREYAPWMKVDTEAVVQAKKDRAARQERLAAEAARKEAEAAFIDLKATDIKSVGGIKETILPTGEVELRWTLDGESKAMKGFIVQRSKAGTKDWETLASWEDTMTLKSRSPTGDTYLYVDSTASIGNWEYRIIAESMEGRAVLNKKLVQIESTGEGFSQYAIVIGLVIFSIIAFVAISNSSGDT